jgi:hypothetical protein
MAVTDELFQGRRSDADVAARLNVLADEMARLLPPGRRGGAGSASDE